MFLRPPARQRRAWVERALPDLILLDINMPEEDGLFACRKFKETVSTSNIPVIFISAASDETTKVKGFQVGVDYVTKPYYPAEVLARVRLHIRMNTAYRALASAHIAQLRSVSQTQKMLLPTPQSVPGARFAGVYQPCFQAGGDFYDVIQTGEVEQVALGLASIAATTEEMTDTIGEQARAAPVKTAQQADRMASMMKEMGGAAQEIGKVTETITSISSQINLLALNATTAKPLPW